MAMKALKIVGTEWNLELSEVDPRSNPWHLQDLPGTIESCDVSSWAKWTSGLNMSKELLYRDMGSLNGLAGLFRIMFH